jgi:hypothetical protein
VPWTFRLWICLPAIETAAASIDTGTVPYTQDMQVRFGILPGDHHSHLGGAHIQADKNRR